MARRAAPPSALPTAGPSDRVWPPFRGGLLRWAEEIGAPVLVTALDQLADQHGSRFVPSPSLRARAAANARFHAA